MAKCCVASGKSHKKSFDISFLTLFGDDTHTTLYWSDSMDKEYNEIDCTTEQELITIGKITVFLKVFDVVLLDWTWMVV